MEDANKLIGAGKKHLVMGRVVEAVNALQEACGLLGKKYGDTADECGEAFFWCGKALLDLSRMENSVLGNALEGVPVEEEEEKPNESEVEGTENVDGEEVTRDELRHQVYDAMAEKKGEGKKTEGTVKVEGKEDEEMKDQDEDCDDQQGEIKDKSGMDGDTGSEEKSEKEADKTSGEEEEEAEADADNGEEEEGGDAGMEDEDTAEKGSDDDDEEEQEEVGNLQLAWEMLEVAKVIYKRKETKEEQLMAAQAHLKLGEVSAESGNYTQALEDFQECLKLQVKHLEPDSRLLAETHYQMGLICNLDQRYSRAIDELKSSISVIKSRLDKLQALLDQAGGPEALPEERKEMEELKALLPEIHEKVEDATEGLKTASAAAEGVTDQQEGGSASEKSESSSKINGIGSTNSSCSAATVSDISHLVRKKRKPESPVKEGGVKKAKQSADQSE